MHQFPAIVAQETVLAKIEELNRDPKIHGILVQLPLPPHFDNGKVLEVISAEKDADGFHLYNLGGLVVRRHGIPAVYALRRDGAAGLLQDSDRRK